MKQLASFSFLTLVLAVLFHLAVTASLRAVKISDLGAFNRAMQGQVNADIIITGSSRAYRHFDPRTISTITGLSAYNLGRNASQTDVQLAVLKTYLRHNRKPLLVIHNLDIHSFVLTKAGQIYDPAQYIPYLAEPELYAALDRIDPSLWRWRFLPLYAYATEDTLFTWTVGFRSMFGLAHAEPCFDGFSPVDKSWTNDFARFKAANSSGVTIPVERNGVAELEAFICLCRDQHIPLLLVFSPQYYEMVGLTNNRAEIFATFRSLTEQYGVPLLDYTNSPISMDRSLFYNSQHLNARGAARFSSDIAERLRTFALSSNLQGLALSSSKDCCLPQP